MILRVPQQQEDQVDLLVFALCYAMHDLSDIILDRFDNFDPVRLGMSDMVISDCVVDHTGGFQEREEEKREGEKGPTEFPTEKRIEG